MSSTATTSLPLATTTTEQTALTPAAAFRNEYYLSQQQPQSQNITAGSDDEENDFFTYRPGAIIYAQLSATSDVEQRDQEDEQDDISIRTIDYFDSDEEEYEEEEETTLFEPKSNSTEPKIILVDENHHHKRPSKLLSKLSKSTAPIKAKLSTLSRSKTNLDHLWVNSSTTLTLPALRKSADHMSLSSRRLGKKKKNKTTATKNERSKSFSFDMRSSSTNLASRSSPTATVTSSTDLIINTTGVNIYPALLSKVAVVFKENMTVGTKTKDSIKYHDVFDGRDAVNKLAEIIKTTDRNLAILVGRALDHQKFFHAVNYESRLRDSVNELYQFNQTNQQHRASMTIKRPKRKLSADSDIMVVAVADDDGENEDRDPSQVAPTGSPAQLLDELPNGLFTLLTDCYSPTCTRNNLCYSVFCPRRNNQQKNQNPFSEENEDRLWIKTVPKSISSKLSQQEKRRQENIFELIYTEKDFVEDLAYVEENWIQPLLLEGSVLIEKSEQFTTDIFWNLPEIRKSNSLLLQDLLKRQSQSKVVFQIGDVFMQHVSTIFEPFVNYGSHQIISKYLFEAEKATNPAFAKWVEVIERLPRSRKLELNGYLTKPTTRLGRYNLLLTEILKHTQEDHPDCKTIPKVMNMISRFLERVNEESGKTENRFSLELLDKKLSYKKNSGAGGNYQDIENLDLLASQRRIIMKGPLKRKSTSNTSSEASELQIYVLDHCLLIIKSKFFDNVECYKLYKKPIPLALLVISLPADQQSKRSSSILPSYNRSSTGTFYSSGSVDFLPPPPPTLSYSSSTSISNNSNKNGYPISFIHLGRQGSGTITLYAPTLASRRKWVDTIERYRHSIMEKTKVFQMVNISDQYFNSFNKVNCAAAYESFIIIGCDHGVYLRKPPTTRKKKSAVTLEKHNDTEDEEEEEEEEEKDNEYDDDDVDDNNDEGIVRILSIDKVSQIEILEGPKLMLILADKILYTYSMETLFDERNNLLVSNLVATSTSSPSSTTLNKASSYIQENTIIRSSASSSIDESSSSSVSSKNRFYSRSSKKTQIKKLSSNVSFFKVGKVFDKSVVDEPPVERTLVCYVKYNAMTSTIRALEPYAESQDGRKKKRKSNHPHHHHLGLLMRNSTDVLRGFKDLYIPGEATSIQYFKNVICVGSAKGFQMVDIGSAGVQSVLDPNDENHNFLKQRGESLKPVSMFRHPDGHILLCYNEIAFYIDKKGRRARADWIINWEGYPTEFAFQYPYILAFDSSFIEIRHIDTGDMIQVIPGTNIRCLKPDHSDTIYCVMEDRGRSGNELVFSLKYVSPLSTSTAI